MLRCWFYLLHNKDQVQVYNVSLQGVIAVHNNLKKYRIADVGTINCHDLLFLQIVTQLEKQQIRDSIL